MHPNALSIFFRLVVHAARLHATGKCRRAACTTELSAYEKAVANHVSLSAVGRERSVSAARIRAPFAALWLAADGCRATDIAVGAGRCAPGGANTGRSDRR